jgi:hypothetical protein
MSDFTEITMCPKIFVGVLKTKYHENPFDQSCAFPYGKTCVHMDMIGLIVFCSTCFAKTPKNAYKNSASVIRSHKTNDGTYTPHLRATANGLLYLSAKLNEFYENAF